MFYLVAWGRWRGTTDNLTGSIEPLISTVKSVDATRAACSRITSITGLDPVIGTSRFC